MFMTLPEILFNFHATSGTKDEAGSFTGDFLHDHIPPIEKQDRPAIPTGEFLPKGLILTNYFDCHLLCLLSTYGSGEGDPVLAPRGVVVMERRPRADHV